MTTMMTMTTARPLGCLVLVPPNTSCSAASRRRPAALPSVRPSSPPPQQMPSLQISFILAPPIPRRQPDASLPHRHHFRRNDVPQIQRDNIRRHKINLPQDMPPPLPRRYVARIRSSLRPPHRRLHVHPVRDA